MGEEVLLEEQGVRITTMEVRIGGTTYPTTRINSVQHLRVNDSSTTARHNTQAIGSALTLACVFTMFFGLLGLVLVVPTITTVRHLRVNVPSTALYDSPVVGAALIVALVCTIFMGPMGLAMVVPVVMVLGRLGRRYVVLLHTVDGDRQVLVTRDANFAGLVRAAIGGAIWKRQQLRKAPRRVGRGRPR